MSDWQPIETAPKDETRIDIWVVWDDGKGERIADSYWGDAYDFDESVMRQDWVVPNGGYDGAEAPLGEERRATHWMPVPKGP